MNLNRFLFQNNILELEEYIDFSNADIDKSHIREIKKCHVKMTAHEYDDLIVADFKVEADIIGVCAYSLEDVPLHLKFHDSLEFSNEISDDEDIYYEEKPIFSLDPYILGLIIAETPLKIIKKGAKLPSSGEGYRVLSEEEYEKEQKSKTDSRWSKLDDIEL